MLDQPVCMTSCSGYFSPFHKGISYTFHTCEECQTKRWENGNYLFVISGRAATEPLTKQVLFEKSRATKPLLSTTPALGHNPCGWWQRSSTTTSARCMCHQPSPTVGSLMSDCWHQCDLGAISSSSHILKGPKSGMSLSVPHWS